MPGFWWLVLSSSGYGISPLNSTAVRSHEFRSDPTFSALNLDTASVGILAKRKLSSEGGLSRLQTGPPAYLYPTELSMGS
ncbi:hypothetical protein BDP81DRAFT_427731 [Colletotrichum phormii]|uniref:Uncharacterized protein n=1 Tax=Colletotrichum phormii TaxID=359342 RepID=A0AAI9ZTE3_9PEZI|nr:uncharacterized protein BDP81DRAFT_427731 [Colletotrichum phormii]KAK1636509.1 hypothetical protein BDP81DRAFT_427731 [Colletotrichum phormii]